MSLRALDDHGSHAYEHATCAVGSGWGRAMVAGPDGSLVCRACGYREDSPGTGTLADGFDLVHRQWGLRGDPHVWAELRDRLRDVPTPGDLPPDDVRSAVLDTFAEITGVDLDAAREARVYRAELDHGGMSGGVVDLGWWRDKGLPLIVERATGRAVGPDA